MNKALPPLTKLKNLPPPQEGGLCINIYELRNWTLYPLPMTHTLAHTTQLLLGNPPILGDIAWPPPRGGGRGGVWGVLEERHPGQFAFSLANRSSPDTQLRTAAPFRLQLILVADEPRSRGIDHSVKICFEDIHLCRNLLEGPLQYLL